MTQIAIITSITSEQRDVIIVLNLIEGARVSVTLCRLQYSRETLAVISKKLAEKNLLQIKSNKEGD